MEREDPYFILGSPMCKVFSVLQSFKGSENYQVTPKRGLDHLRFCMDVYAWQASRGPEGRSSCTNAPGVRLRGNWTSSR